MSGDAWNAADGRPLFPAERAKTFADAVVAIAMTLLILPLMESVSESASGGGNAEEWFLDHWQQLLSFGISFGIIALLWIVHHRLFAAVERVSSGLLWLMMLWLISIVWLPVATALSSQERPDDLVKVVYIGSMILPCLVSLLIRLFLRARPSLHHISNVNLRRGMAVDLAMAVMFAVALAVAVALPNLSYFPLFLMVLVGRVQALFARMLGAGGRPKVSERTGR